MPVRRDRFGACSWFVGPCHARTAALKARKATISSSRPKCPALIATFTRRWVVISAPILMSLKRIEPAVATAKAVLRNSDPPQPLDRHTSRNPPNLAHFRGIVAQPREDPL